MKVLLVLLLPFKALAEVKIISANQLKSVVDKIYGIKNLKNGDPNNPFATSNGHGGGNGVMELKNLNDQKKVWGYTKDGSVIELEGIAVERLEKIDDK
jgi:hypothetical protein